MNLEDHNSAPLNNKNLKKHPFKVDEDYFSGLTENIMNAIEAENSDLKYNLHLKKTPFTTPEGYFDELADKIEMNVSKSKSVPLFNRAGTKWIAVAASLALLVTMYFVQPGQTKKGTDWNSISDETIISFLEREDALNDDLLIDLDQIDAVLDEIYTNEISTFTSAISRDPELEYDFEYFDY